MIATLAGLLVATNAVVCSPEFPDRCSHPVKTGEKAKLTGQVLSTPLAITLGQKADGCPKRTKIAVDAAVAKVRLEKDLDIKELQVDVGVEFKKRQLAESALELMKDRAEAAEERAVRRWYEHPGLWLGIGVVAGAAAIIGTAAALDETLGD